MSAWPWVVESFRWARIFDHQPTRDEVAEAIKEDRPKRLSTLITIRHAPGEEWYILTETILEEYGLWGRRQEVGT